MCTTHKKNRYASDAVAQGFPPAKLSVTIFIFCTFFLSITITRIDDVVYAPLQNINNNISSTAKLFLFYYFANYLCCARACVCGRFHIRYKCCECNAIHLALNNILGEVGHALISVSTGQGNDTQFSQSIDSLVSIPCSFLFFGCIVVLRIRCSKQHEHLRIY